MKMKIHFEPCPFCGKPSECHIVRNTETMTHEVKPLPTDWRLIDITAGMRYANGHYRMNYTYDIPSYIPRCTDPKCIGRLGKRFPSLEEAAAAWNQRKEKN